MARKEEIVMIANEVSSAEGVELYWVSYQNTQAAQRLQILIDKTGGVSLDDCARVSKAIETRLDETIDHQYELEVSSPGAERPLHVQEHYEKAIGEEIKVKTYAPINGNKVWSGVLKTVEEDSLHIETESGPLEIAISQIAQAQISPQFDYS